MPAKMIVDVGVIVIQNVIRQHGWPEWRFASKNSNAKL